MVNLMALWGRLWVIKRCRRIPAFGGVSWAALDIHELDFGS